MKEEEEEVVVVVKSVGVVKEKLMEKLGEGVVTTGAGQLGRVLNEFRQYFSLEHAAPVLEEPPENTSVALLVVSSDLF